MKSVKKIVCVVIVAIMVAGLMACSAPAQEPQGPSASVAASETPVASAGGQASACLLYTSTKIPCYVAEDAVSCVAIGTGKALESIDVYSAGAVYDYRRGDYYNQGY